MTRKFLPKYEKKLSWAALWLVLVSALFSMETLAQTTVSGLVTNSKLGEPLPGINIVIKGTTTGTITDEEGKYAISVNELDILVFSFIGFVTQEIPVGNQAKIDIALVEDTRTLDEVVVTGYTSESKRNITGAVASVNVENALKVPVESFEQALLGNVSGVSGGQQGTPGGQTTIRIRGFGTFGNNDPLYVIDGMPTRTNLNEINPNDIESIQVLKDASAASIYGSRAGNGVIIITTKQGTRNGKTKISYEGYVGVQMANESQFPKLLTPQQEAQYVFDAQTNATGTFSHVQYGSSLGGPVLPEFINPTGLTGDPGPYDPETNRVMRANHQGTDWFDAIFRTSNVQNHNISASGGSKNSKFAFSAGYYDQDGILRDTGFDRISARLNSTHWVKDRVRLGQNLAASYSIIRGNRLNNEVNVTPVIQAIKMNPIVPILDEGGGFGGVRGGGLGATDNPVAELDRKRNNRDRTIRLFGNAFVAIDLLQDRNLTLKSTIGIDYSSLNRNDFSGINHESRERRAINSLAETSTQVSSWVWTNTVNWVEDFGDHRVDILAGTEALDSYFKSIFATGSDFFSNDPDFLHLSAGQGGGSNAGFGSESSLFSYFGKANYSYKGKYLFTGTLRRDGSSRFGASNRWGTFPAFSVGWRVSDEDFMTNTTAISNLKLRAAWGQTGNQEIGDFGFASFFGPDLQFSTYDITGSQTAVAAGFDASSIGNPDVKWETTATINFGIEVGFMENRLNLEVDVYNRKTSDMLIQLPLPGTVGLAAFPFFNAGDLENKGFDLGITYQSSVSNGFSWDVNLNFSRYQNKVTNLGDDVTLAYGGFNTRGFSPSLSQVNMPLGSFYGMVIDGIFQNQAEVDAHAAQDGAAPGRFKFRDVDGNGVIDDGDRDFIGNPHPDFTYGISVNLNYDMSENGTLQLSLFGNGIQGNDLFNFTKWFTDLGNFQGALSERVLNSWSPENPGATHTAPTTNRPGRENTSSTFFIEDGSYFRLKNVQLSYQLPRRWLNIIGVDDALIYIQARNLVTITNYSGLDPEITLRYQDPHTAAQENINLDIGVDRGTYPVQKALLLGLKFGF